MTLLASSALQSLPDPTVIESPDFESLLSEVKQDILRFAPELKDAMELESEPASKIAQAIAYRVMHERHLANSQALALMLAKAMGPQLDHLGSLPFIQTSRKVLREEDKSQNPPLPAEYENDTEFRARLQLALEGYSTAGPIGAYIYHGLAAHQDVKDIAIDAPTFSRYKVPAAVAATLPSHTLLLTTDYDAGLTNPTPGDVAITVLSRKGNGKPTSEVMKAVSLRLNDNAIRPLTDRPRLRPATIVNYRVRAYVWFYPGPDAAITIAEAQRKTEHYTEERQLIGHDVTLSGLHAAIHVPGVQRVELVEPSSDLDISQQEASNCLSIELINRGTAV